MTRTAVIAGATGLVGGHCLRRLASAPEYSRVVALVRRPSGVPQERMTDFDRLAPDDVEEGADVFCALGTTIKKAGSQKAFRRVDFEYPVALARLAEQRGSPRFLVVSSVGADPGSSNFYLRTKGEMEREIAALPFEAVHIFRPSFLIGDRQESRPGERIAIALARPLGFVLGGPLRKYRAITAECVAAAMVRFALSDARGIRIHHFDEMR
jgi:uncharacterized protein YbjT (DUF2867 family)